MPDKTKTNKAQTGWVIAATEGATIDGRNITKEWIKDMAELYSVDEYTAVIWPEHFRSSWGPFDGKNWGIVDEVKASKQGGKLRLFVKLTANQYLLDANKDGQKLFMSIEPNTDYKGTGKCYLQGLAVTDKPASTGTTRLKFSAGESEEEHDYSQLETLFNTDFIFSNNSNSNDDAKNSKEDKAKTLFTQLFNLFSTPSPQQATEASDNAEDEPMTKEQLDALIGKIDGVTTKFSDLENKFSTLETQVQTFSKKDAEDVELDKDKDVDADKNKEKITGITAEQFSQLNTTLSGLSEKFTGMETKFNKLNQEVEGQEPNPSGGGETVNLV